MKARIFQQFIWIYTLVFVPLALMGQIKDVGLPFVQNYSRNTYGAAAQNWNIAQDQRGVMYFGNTDGLLSFNGSQWETHPLPNSSIVRSIVTYDNKVFVGGYNELGYFEQNQFGDLIYYSLVDKLPAHVKSFDEVWRIFNTKNGIVFQTYYYIFSFQDGEFSVFHPKSKFGFSYQAGEHIYVVDRDFGLYNFSKNELSPIALHDDFFNENEITFIVPGVNKDLLLGTTNKGVFTVSEGNLIPWENAISATFKKHQIYTGLNLGEEQIAVGTIQNGLYIIDKTGRTIMHLNRGRKLQNNTILSLFFDRNKNLWLGLDNGIDLLEVNSPISIFDYSYYIESSYASIVHNNYLYIGTNQGLFTQPINRISNHNILENGFEKVDGVLGQVWNLEEIQGDLVCGHNFGAALINENKSKRLSSVPGSWDVAQVPWDKRYLIDGNYSGLSIYFKASDSSSWVFVKSLKGFDESCKEIMFDHLGNLWITHAIKGLFRIQLSADLSIITSVTRYSKSDGLSSLPYRLCYVDGKTLILSNDKLYEFISDREGFDVNIRHTNFFKDITQLNDVYQDDNGDVWYFSENQMGVFRLQEDATFTHITKPFLRIRNNFMAGSFENIYSISDKAYLIGSQDGMLHYSSEKLKTFDLNYSTYLKGVKIKSFKKGIADTIHELRLNLKMGNTTLTYANNSIYFNFFTPYFEGEEVVHSYRLVGLDKEWSVWDKVNAKEYSHLPEGDYVFEVKAKNVYENESLIAQFRFSIKPPFYRSQFSYFLYFLLVVIILIFNILYYRNKIKRARKLEAEKMVSKQNELTQEVIQSEVKIEKLQEEKMAGEMRLKNIELANSTMHLVQKNKLLTRIKKELLAVSDKAKSNAVKVDISELVKRIDKDINNDKNFKLFDEYFDRVHQDFLKRLKELHPDLTPKDMRLCAYLKMNISTKEIAPLMNVSTRGLEISRYRLRKKLNLAREDNLVEYILGI